jgi:hypothetical protein
MPESTKADIAALNAQADRLNEMTMMVPSWSCPPYGDLPPQTTVGQQGNAPYVRPYIPSVGSEPYRRPAGVPIDTVEVRPLPPPVHIAPPPPRVFLPERVFER